MAIQYLPAGNTLSAYEPIDFRLIAKVTHSFYLLRVGKHLCFPARNNLNHYRPSATIQFLHDSCLKLFDRTGCRDYARFDWRLDHNGTPRLLEVNPNPGWCWDGHLAEMAKLDGLSYADMLKAIVQTAKENVMPTRSKMRATVKVKNDYSFKKIMTKSDLSRRRFISGCVQAFPLMNPLGFESGLRHITMSGEDLNRSFPAMANHSPALPYFT